MRNYVDLMIKLLQQLSEENDKKGDTDSNIFISVYSIVQTLAMLANGADGNTLDEMKKAFKFNNSNLKELGRLISSQQRRKHVLSSNAILTSSSLKSVILEEYIKNSLVAGKIFDNPEEMKEWSIKETNGKIVIDLDSLPENNALVLANAFYFNANWKKPWKSNNSDIKFNNKNGSKSNKIEFMQHNIDRYIQYHSTISVKIDYKAEGYSFIAILPNNIEQFVRGLNTQLLGNLNFSYKSFSYRTVGAGSSIIMPQFSYSGNYELSNTLKKIGMVEAFTSKANFNKLANCQIMVSSIKHQSYIDVNKIGTEAAAITSARCIKGTRRIQKSDKVDLLFNKPFVYMIYDEVIDLPIAIGIVNKL